MHLVGERLGGNLKLVVNERDRSLGSEEERAGSAEIAAAEDIRGC